MKKFFRYASKAKTYIRGWAWGIALGGGSRPKRVLGHAYLEGKYIEFGKNVIVYPNVHIFGEGVVKIGDNVTIGDGTIIICARSIEIGDDTMIANQCCILDCNHGMHLNGTPMNRQNMSVKPVSIGKDCWLGAGVMVLPGSTIDDGAVIGANSVVSGEVEGNSIHFNERSLSTIERRT